MVLSRKNRSLIGAALAASVLSVLVLVGCTDWARHHDSQRAVQFNLTSLSPSSVPVGASSQTLTINGGGFLGSSVVTFNGAAHQAAFINSSQLSILLSNADLEKVGDFAVTVENGDTAVAGYVRVEGGTLQLRISGLPAEQPGSVSITSASGFTSVISSTRTLQVPPGTYLVSANGVGMGGLNYYSDPAEQSVSIVDGSPDSLEVSYTMVTARMQPLDPRTAAAFRLVLTDAPVPEQE